MFFPQSPNASYKGQENWVITYKKKFTYNKLIRVLRIGSYYRKSTSFIKPPPPEQPRMFKTLFQFIYHIYCLWFKVWMEKPTIIIHATDERIFNHQLWGKGRRGGKSHTTVWWISKFHENSIFGVQTYHSGPKFRVCVSAAILFRMFISDF